jgi:hypothetical protein
MRSKTIFAAAVAAAALGLAAPMPAEAFDLNRDHYRIGSPADPYSYQPAQPRYYPYYNSGYWRPIEEMRGSTRYRFKLPRYYQAWGWNSRKWYLAHKDDRRFRHR